MKRLQFCLVVFAVLALTFSVFAQVQNGQFAGTVLDPTGAAIAGAKVTVTNPATALSLSAATNSSGAYSVREVPIGVYKITVEAAGFKTISNAGVTVNAGTIAHVDFKMQIGKASEVVEVTGEATAVNTEDSKLATTVGSAQLNNLPLNGRNVYDLMQMSAGAVNVNGVDFENGHGTVVNGVRENFNGFLINGIDNKGLSGGVVNTPIQDTVQEFQELTLNTSAQYGSSAGSINNLVTKSGTNTLHGSGWYYGRNDVFDANDFFDKGAGNPQPATRFSQYGGTIGGALIKDKLFYYGAIEGDHFNASAPAVTVTQEDPAFSSLVESTFPNSVSSLLFSKFSSPHAGTAISGDTISCYGPTCDPNTNHGYLGLNVADYLDPCNANFAGDPQGPQHIPLLVARMVGYNPATDDTALCVNQHQSLSFFGGLAYNTPALLANRNTQMLDSAVASFGSQTQTLGNLFNGREWSAKIDYDPNASNRFALSYNWFRSTDSYGPLKPQGARGFLNPERQLSPTGSFSWVHTFTPTVLNELRAGYTQNNTGINISSSSSGVPQIGFDDGSLGFGSYAGYPQFFKENIYQYSDMVSLSHGNHSIKIGGDIRRNIENSVFNVARPSYYFYDMMMFAIDQPYSQTAGVDPGICTPPCKSYNQNPQAFLQSNERHWRNIEAGLYFQDDWKVTKRLTLNLGLRWDKYQRHNEEGNTATTFLRGPGSQVIDNLSTGQGWLQQANIPGGTAGTINGVNYVCTSKSEIALAQMAGQCGPGGFAPVSSLGTGRNKDFGPRLGFAWDVFGDGKTSLRGGFGISFEGTLYNPLSNSRWNLPYYSFNLGSNFLNGDIQTLVYGPYPSEGQTSCPDCPATPTYTGPPTNIGQGTGAQAYGNLVGWFPGNSNTAYLTGIVEPKGVDDPYIYNSYLSIQREVASKLVLEADYVGTVGHKLFRSENLNSIPGGRLPEGACVTDNFGRQLCSQKGAFNPVGVLNPNYGTMREWQNNVNSSYNAFQFQVKKQMSHGLLLNANYTWSHSIDNGSGWHNSATGANGAAAGDGFTTDQTLPGLDRGNSIFDIRQRVVLNYVYQIPGPKQGIAGAVLGGWQYSGIWAFQSGAHWEPYIGASAKLINPATGSGCVAADVAAGNCVNVGGDYNLNNVKDDRPNSTISRYNGSSRAIWANGMGMVFDKSTGIATSSTVTFSPPCLGCSGNLGRNTFVGPGQWYADMTVGKTFKLTERFNLNFQAQGFNVFNRANFILATPQASAHNKITDPAFGQAASTLNPRQMQFGVKLSF